jgi:hypothetical protein
MNESIIIQEAGMKQWNNTNNADRAFGTGTYTQYYT